MRYCESGSIAPTLRESLRGASRDCGEKGETTRRRECDGVKAYTGSPWVPGAALVKHLAELVGDEAPSQSVGNAGPHLHRDEHIEKRYLSPSLQAFRGRVPCSSGLH
jgi:hypothetical protein